MKVLEGKKTYLAAAALVLVAVIGFWFNLLLPAESVAIFATAFGLFGLGDKADRYGAIAMEVLEKLKQAEEMRSASVEVLPMQIGEAASPVDVKALAAELDVLMSRAVGTESK